jgi:hypothetical protein
LRNSRSFRKPGSNYLAFIVAAALALGAASAWSPKFITPAHAQTPSPAPVEIEGTQSIASGRSTTSFSEALTRSLQKEQSLVQVAIHRPLAGRAGEFQDEADGFDPGESAGSEEQSSESRKRRHRVRKAEFPGGGDNGTVIPPDTQGTVGPNHLMVVLNSNVTIETRTGAVLSSVPIASFWSSLGGINDAYDSRVLFDRDANRWIISSGSNAVSPTAYILIGVSQTNDPTLAWNLYKVPVDASGASWADYPTLGFNGDWIVVQTNVFTVSESAFVASNIYAFDKADLYAGGAGQYTVFHDPTGFTDYPAVTHDDTLATEYLVRNWDGASGTLRVSTITGAVGAEVLTVGVAFPKGANAWQDTAAENFAPQLGSSARIDTDDDRIENCVYRNGSVWAAQTVFFPATGTPTRASAQWWQIDTAGGSVGVVQQLGKRDDPSGAFDYAYPTLDVNADDDMMIGYSRFGASQYASANYSYRLHSDPPNTLETDTVFKAGEAPYFKDFGTGDNRWGDYSNVAVDPLNDVNLWTIQEYAGTDNTWGTWWGSITLSGDVATPTATATTTSTPTPTRKPKPTRTPIEKKTPKPTPTRTPKPTRTPTPTRTPKLKRTPTATPTPARDLTGPRIGVVGRN